MHLTTQELDAARAKYRGQIIPADALSVMDAETEALRASGIERRALEPGAVAPDFMLPDAQGRCVRLQSLLCQGPVFLVFYSAREKLDRLCQSHRQGIEPCWNLTNAGDTGGMIKQRLPDKPMNGLLCGKQVGLHECC
jgi:hypothetical protein